MYVFFKKTDKKPKQREWVGGMWQLNFIQRSTYTMLVYHHLYILRTSTGKIHSHIMVLITGVTWRNIPLADEPKKESATYFILNSMHN